MMKKGWFLLLLIAAAAGIAWWRNQQLLQQEMQGVAHSNGRLELARSRVASLRGGRVAEIFVQEGQAVAKGEVLLKMSSEEAAAKLAAAQAAKARAQSAVARAESAEQRAKSAQTRASGGISQADAQIAAQQAQLAIAEEDVKNARQLFKQNLVSAAELKQREKARDALQAALQAAKAGKSQANAGNAEAAAAIAETSAAVNEARAAVAQAEAEIRAIEAAIDDLTIRAPLSGRVEYMIAELGNVLAAGSILLSIADSENVSLDIFLPLNHVGQIALGAEARIVPDGMNAVFPATVSQIAEQAQFTPKYVETAAEREQLRYRLTLKIPQEIAAQYAAYLKGGMTAQGYVQINQAVDFPPELAVKLPNAH